VIKKQLKSDNSLKLLMFSSYFSAVLISYLQQAGLVFLYQGKRTKMILKILF